MDAVNEILCKDGYFDKNISDYEIRTDQIEMARIVQKTIADNGKFICEGECGVGKTYAYLIPAIEHAVRTGQKCLVVTDGISLQEQLYYKDIPTVANAIENRLVTRKIKYSCLKGRNNYLCKNKVDSFFLNILSNESLNLKSSKKEKEIVDWINKTVTGDVSEFIEGIPDKLRDELCVMNNNCVAGCSFKVKGLCFYERAKNKAFQSDICVTNYHLLMFDYKSGFRVLKEAFQTLVLDEAHQIENVVNSIFDEKVYHNTADVIYNKLFEKALCIDLGNLIDKYCLNPDIFNKQEAEDLFEELKREFHIIFDTIISVNFSNSKICIAEKMNKIIDTKPILDVLDRITAYLLCIIGTLEEIREVIDSENIIPDFTKTSMAILSQTSKIDSMYTTFRAMKGKGNHVVWADKEDVSLNFRVSDFSNYTRNIFEAYDSTIITSATLTVDNNFKFFMDKLGLNEDETNTLIAKSPYSLSEQLLWYKFNKMPDIKDDTYLEYLRSSIRLSIDVVGGGALCLFTSIKKMNEVCSYLRKESPHLNILKQGELPQSEIISRFRDDKDSVLIGTRSLFTGIDVKGDSLRLLILDKLPFPQVDDPIIHKLNLNQHWYTTFMNYSIPKMMIDLKQIVGRAIRSKTDKCIMLIFDPRFETAKYSGRIKGMFGDMLVTNNYKSFPYFVN